MISWEINGQTLVKEDFDNWKEKGFCKLNTSISPLNMNILKEALRVTGTPYNNGSIVQCIALHSSYQQRFESRIATILVQGVVNLFVESLHI